MAKYKKYIQSGYGIDGPLPELTLPTIVAQRAPTAADDGYPIGTFWDDEPANTIYCLTSVGGGVATWTVVAAQGGGYPITPYVVGPTGGYATIQAAINAANAAGGGAVFIQPGTYVEDLTLFDAIALWGTDIDTTIIVGIHTPPAAGTISLQFLRLNSATHILSSGAAGTTNIIINECIINVTNGYIFNLPAWTGYLDIFSSTSVGTNDGVVNNTGASFVFLANSSLGVGVGNTMTVTATNLIINSTDINCPITVAGASTAEISEGSLLTRLLTTAGTTTLVAQESTLAAISHGSAGVMSISNCTITTAVNPAIAGAGAGVLTLTGVDFTNNSNLAGTLTTASGLSRGGNFISQYVVGPAPDAHYQTVQAGINAANAAGGGTVYIKPGTYTENLTLYSGVSLWGGDIDTTIIVGVHVPPLAGTLSMQFLRLNSATHILNSAAAGTTNIIINECIINVTNGYIFNLPNWTGYLDLFSSTSVGTNDGIVNNTGASYVFLANSSLGVGVGNTMTLSGVNLIINSTDINCPVTITGATAAEVSEGSLITQLLTTAGTSTLVGENSTFAAISHGSAGAMSLADCVVTTATNPALDGAGAGAINLNGVAFTNNAAIAATLTITKVTAFDAPLVRATSLQAQGDVGAVAGSVTYTNVVDEALGAGVGAVLMKTGNPGNSSGWLKIYNGTDVRYVPYWTNISP